MMDVTNGYQSTNTALPLVDARVARILRPLPTAGEEACSNHFETIADSQILITLWQLLQFCKSTE